MAAIRGRTGLRAGLVVLTAANLALGIWTQWFPANFYASVPTVDLTPPYSEHFIPDFGGAMTGLAVVFGIAAIRLHRQLVLAALVGYLAFAVPHAAFHLQHLGQAGPGRAAVLVIVLTGTVVVPTALLSVAARVLPACSHPSDPGRAE